MQLVYKLLLFIFIIAVNPASADSIWLSGNTSFNIRRSTSENWSSSSGATLGAMVSSPGMYRILVETTLIAPPAWSGRHLRVKLSNTAVWQAISPLAVFNEIILVSSGFAFGPNELARNLENGNHPQIPLILESRADVSAFTGPSAITIKYTLIAQ